MKLFDKELKYCFSSKSFLTFEESSCACRRETGPRDLELKKKKKKEAAMRSYPAVRNAADKMDINNGEAPEVLRAGRSILSSALPSKPRIKDAVIKIFMSVCE